MNHVQLARAARCIVLLTAAVLVHTPASASASVISSTISTPSDPSYLQENSQTPTPITVSGTAIDNGTPGAVDLRCYAGQSSELFASEVPVSYSSTDGTFSSTFIPSGINLEQTCVLRAVPAGEEPASLRSFVGSRVGLSDFENTQVSAGPHAGEIQDFFISDSQLDGVGDYRSLSSGGMYDASPLDSSFAFGGDLFFANDTYDALSGGGVSGSSVQVDGIDAYGPASAASLFTGASSLTGFQPLTVSHSYDSSTGDLTVHESEPLVQCTPEPAVYPPTESSCTSFVSAGVSVSRTIHQSQEGRQSTLTDTYSSTDGQTHQLHLVSMQDASSPAAGYDFPWVDSTTYKERSAGEVISPPTQAPVTVFLDYKNSQADNDPEGAQGAITFSGVPDGFAFANSGQVGQTHLTATFTRTLSSSAPVTLTQVFSWSSARSQAQTLATMAQSAQSPVAKITSPANEAALTTSSVLVTGTVIPGGNGMPEAVTVQGKMVPLAPDGSFSTEVPLSAGANTITATATDVEKLSSSATVSVTYQPAKTPPTETSSSETSLQNTGSQSKSSGSEAGSASQPSSQSGSSSQSSTPVNEGLIPIALTSSASISRLNYGSHGVLVTLTCHGLESCKGRAGITFKRRQSTHGKGPSHTETVTIVAGNFSIPAGQTKTLALGLSATARSYLAKHSPLPGTLTVMLAEPDHQHAYLQHGVILREPNDHNARQSRH